jgi:quercetin dioxygenase-like cupin family protein
MPDLPPAPYCSIDNLPAVSSDKPNLPLPVRAPLDVVDHQLEPLLAEPFAKVWASSLPGGLATGSLRERLMGRLAASREAEAAMTTTRRSRAARKALAPGVAGQTLYSATSGRPLRPGEPLRARLIELAPGTTLTSTVLGDDDAFSGCHAEWLVLAGRIELGGQVLSQRDYHVSPAGQRWPTLQSLDGALLFLRESDLPAQAGDLAHTVFDAQAEWLDFAPGIRRRVLWQRDGQAALLYHAQPGAQVPQHTHGHDEECLMVQGELFLDDLLLQPGDYQLAPAGTGHRVTETDTGVVIYAHGDLELQFIA